MLDRLRSHSFSYQAPVLVCLLAILLLLVLPTGFEGALIYQEAERCTARVLETDNSAIIDTGLVRSGEQRCQLEILDGRFQGRTVTGINMLNGSLEQDKLFSPGDRAQVVVSHDGDTITNVTMSDHYRLGWEALMAAGFALFLILFAGRTGVRAIASFVLTVLCLWKLLVPLYLKGWNPIWVGLAITLFLTILIIALVYGFDRRCWAAAIGPRPVVDFPHLRVIPAFLHQHVPVSLIIRIGERLSHPDAVILPPVPGKQLLNPSHIHLVLIPLPVVKEGGIRHRQLPQRRESKGGFPLSPQHNKQKSNGPGNPFHFFPSILPKTQSHTAGGCAEV